jgi:asparagine synthase (glutamine-hydrolysing)
VSGFVGVIHLDGSPIDRSLLQRLTDFQKFRGPDAQHIWIDGHVGLGHTLLKVTPESEHEHQPFTLDGDTWIVADCRVDARRELIAQLCSRVNRDLAGVPDVELILCAYNLWDDDCVEHLLGDFAFAIWDGRHQRLFCARDQMGVKPFYYARVGTSLIFSNTLNCIRQHPAVSGDLNDLAIADFLLFDMIREPGATSFRDIRRLPPAHTITVAAENVSTRRYWTLPVSEPIHHERNSDCVEQFRELLHSAVADRLRAGNVGILMSGGLDSSTVAATAQAICIRQARPSHLCAYTEVFDTLIPHEERYYAGLVAAALDIPIHFLPSDDCTICKLDQRDSRFPEPVHSPWSCWGISALLEVATSRRVALTGFGGDPTMSSLLSFHFRQLIKKMQVGRALVDAARYLASEGRLSRLYIRTRWRRWFSSTKGTSYYPAWLNRELEKKLCLRQRWQDLNAEPPLTNAIRPTAIEAILSPSWPTLFEGFDSGATHVPVEVCHPFFDLRLMRFLLTLPALPWCSDKELLREVSRDVLPKTVRLRRKSPLIADPLVALLQRADWAWVDYFEAVPRLGHYVDRKRIPKVFRERDPWSAWIHLRPLSLNFWLLSEHASGISKL